MKYYISKLALSIVFILVLLPGARAAQAEATGTALTDTFELGNQAYTAGEFTTALEYYRKTGKQRGFSAALLYNMGNTFAAMNEPGEAILAYRQALRIDHGNNGIQSSLTNLTKNQGLYREDQPLWQQLPDLLDADQWMLVSGCSFFLCSGFFLGMTLRKKKEGRRITGTAALTFFISFLVTLPFAVYQYQGWNDAVVLTESRLQISPFPDAASIGTIKEGRVVRPEKEHNAYILVTDFSGRKGWIGKDTLGRISELPGQIN